MTEALHLPRHLASRAPNVPAATPKPVNRARGPSLNEHLNAEGLHCVDTLSHAHGTEARAARLEQRETRSR